MVITTATIIQADVKLQNLTEKIVTDPEIARCGKDYIRITKCKNNLGKYICKRNNNTDDNCIVPLLKNQSDKCSIIQEYNPPLLQIDEGFILLDRTHTVNNHTTTEITLVEFTDEVHIDNITYKNIHAGLLEAIHTKHSESFEIIKILYTDTEYACNNLDSLKKFYIPVENHPFRSFIYLIIIATGIISCLYTIIKISKYCIIYRQRKADENFKILYRNELVNLQANTV